jgi:predicted outer membrane repeat protein
MLIAASILTAFLANAAPLRSAEDLKNSAFDVLAGATLGATAILIMAKVAPATTARIIGETATVRGGAIASKAVAGAVM